MHAGTHTTDAAGDTAKAVTRQDFPDGLRLDLDLGVAAYPVFVTKDPARLLATYLKSLAEQQSLVLDSPPRVVVLCDQNTAELFGIETETQFITAGWQVDALTIPAGDSAKSLATVEQICEALAVLGATRRTLLCSLGGGVISDTAGMVAALYKRGMPLVHLPTTLVGLIDAAIGGKAAVNTTSTKNLIGLYKHPLAVASDLAFLDQLSIEDYAAGLAEAAKTAILSGESCIEWMEENTDQLLARDPATLQELIARCIAFKARVVADDPYENTLPSRRQALNYGHTLGHVIETVTALHAGQQAAEAELDQQSASEADQQSAAFSDGQTPSAISHGIAIAQGMRFEARLAMQLLDADRDFVLRQDALLDRLGLSPLDPAIMGDDITLIEDAFYRDKKVINNDLRFVLLPSAGRPELVTVPREVLHDHLRAWLDSAQDQ